MARVLHLAFALFAASGRLLELRTERGHLAPEPRELSLRPAPRIVLSAASCSASFFARSTASERPASDLRSTRSARAELPTKRASRRFPCAASRAEAAASTVAAEALPLTVCNSARVSANLRSTSRSSCESLPCVCRASTSSRACSAARSATSLACAASSLRFALTAEAVSRPNRTCSECAMPTSSLDAAIVLSHSCLAALIALLAILLATHSLASARLRSAASPLSASSRRSVSSATAVRSSAIFASPASRCCVSLAARALSSIIAS
mmetsp:Transcript_24041/g.57106  ORF Transcript_24041/g.57106 Transcript_24041/m.57106 type:complete len:268 (-) Transcript_24041:1620-2423(-)